MAVGGAQLDRPAVPRATLPYRLLKAALRPPAALLLRRPRVEGIAHVPAQGPVILCANHLSVADPVVMALPLPRMVCFLGKHESFGRRWRWLFTRLGVVPVAREGGAAAESSLERGRQVLAAGAVLALFPEGTRSPDGRLYRGKTGAARLAIRSGAPIVPIGISGTRAVLPPGALLPRRTTVSVRFGPPIDLRRRYGGAEDHEVLRAATDEVMAQIAALSGQERVDVYAAQARAAQAARRPVDDFARLRPDDDSLTLDDSRSA